MKTIVLLLIGTAALFVTAGCEEEGHGHHGYGGAYDGTYHDYGHERYQGYQGREGYRDRSDDWHGR